MFFNLAPLEDGDLKDLNVDPKDLPGVIKKDDDPKDPINQDPTNVIVKETFANPLDAPSLELDEEDEKALIEKNNTDPLNSSDPADPDGNAPKAPNGTIDYVAYYNMLVDKGIWFPLQDAEGKVIENPELDDNSFNELSIQQAKWKIEDEENERTSQYGQQYKMLLDHLANGGKIEDLANSFKEELDISNLDSSNPEHAETIIAQHCEAMGWTKKRTDSYINSLKDQGVDVLKETADESKEALVSAITEQRQEMIEATAKAEKQKRDSQERFTKSIKEVIYKDSLPERDKKELEKFYFDYKHALPGGKATDFYLKFQEIQSDPAKYYKFIKFVKDIDKFEEASVVANKTTTKNFNLIRTGESVKKSDTSYPNKTDIKPSSPTIFKRIFK